MGGWVGHLLELKLRGDDKSHEEVMEVRAHERKRDEPIAVVIEHHIQEEVRRLKGSC